MTPELKREADNAVQMAFAWLANYPSLDHLSRNQTAHKAYMWSVTSWRIVCEYDISEEAINAAKELLILEAERV